MRQTADLGLVPAGLTDLDTARISSANAAARTESTRRLHSLLWGQWERWCAERRIGAAGLDSTRITAHSLRAGHTTAAALAGVPLDRAAQARHKDLTVLVNRHPPP